MTRVKNPRVRGVPIAVALLAALAAPTRAGAQRIESRFETRALPSPENPVIEIAKWTTGGLAAAAGVLAFVMQNDAEDRLHELERFCEDSPTVCAQVTPDGAYADPSLEETWQDIRDDYRDSRLLLLGAHVLAVGSVVLFILDLPRDATPENIPYEPPALRVGVRADGSLEATFRYPVSRIGSRVR